MPSKVLPTSPAELSFVVRADHPRQRLDRLVVALLESAGRPETRAEVQRWIRQGHVRVDGEVAVRRTVARVGASVCVTPAARLLSEAMAEESVRFEIVYEDEHLVVVHKPAGLVVHPARGHRSGTLVNGLLARCAFAESAADPRDRSGNVRPGIVHRLDKDTSGLLVVAKDAPTREGLKAQFARHSIERRYTALVSGTPPLATYDTPYGRHPRSRLRFTSKLSVRAATLVRRAVTQIVDVQPLGPASLVCCELRTGRTHQIRVHLAEQALTPILADSLYGGPSADPQLQQLASSLGRQALHAGVLGFVHPASEAKLRFQAALPADMAATVDALRGCCPTKPST